MRFDKLFELLSIEYNCSVSDFRSSNNVLTVSEMRDGARKYSDSKYFFHMVTTGANAVVTADRSMVPFLEDFISHKLGHTLFEIPNLLKIERELNKFGYTLTTTYQMFLSDSLITPVGDHSVRWFCDEEIHQFYGDSRFPNAICDRFLPHRPDKLVVCAYDGDNIMGMAGCSEDAPCWQQIGIDVLPEYRSRGVGTYLVTLLKNTIENDGNIPFYGTSLSNYHSWNIALNSGFRPAWVEIGSKRI